MLRMLRAVQYVQIGGERRRLTFRALDVEQIGYVYEGLLELEVRTATDVVARPGPPGELAAEDQGRLPRSRSPRSPPGRTTDILRLGWPSVPAGPPPSIRTALDGRGHHGSAGRGRPRRRRRPRACPMRSCRSFGVLRCDERGLPAITPPGGRYVTRSSPPRRDRHPLHAAVPRRRGRRRRPAATRLPARPAGDRRRDARGGSARPPRSWSCKVADIAMGSGAFLVAACRYLADRLVEAWQAEGRADALAADQHQQAYRVGADAEADQVLLDARRRITEHCLYGVDINPLAVEMAKLSLWLITMDRERPFGFLDDRLVCGDSLLGLVSMDQLEYLHVDPDAGRRLHHGTLDFAAGLAHHAFSQAADLRRRITAAPGVTIRDIEHKARLLAQARELSGTLNVVADAITADGLAAAKLKGKKCDAEFVAPLSPHQSSQWTAARMN